MSYSVASVWKSIADRLPDPNDSVDIAVQFIEVIRSNDILVPSRESQIYGGRYLIGDCKYDSSATEFDCLVIRCTNQQYELIMDDHPRIEGNGGRGSGKSEGGMRKCLRKIVECPGEHGRVVSPTYDLTRIIWSKILSVLPLEWLLPGKLGIRRGDRELWFRNGTIVQFRSADDPDSLRSWGGSWAFVDEEQDVKTEAIDILWPCLRLTATPQLWSVGTPKPGEYQERHKKLLEDKNSSIHAFCSYDNIFIPSTVFDLAKAQMGEQTFRQEIMAEWVFEDEMQLVAQGYDQDIHGIDTKEIVGRDITAKTIETKTRLVYEGGGRCYIAGCDYNLNWPSYAIIYRVFAPNIWIAVDELYCRGHVGHLAQMMTEHGYNPKNTLIIDDASGEYNEVVGPKTSAKLMRDAGYKIRHHRKNPRVRDRVNAFLAKLSPTKGLPTWRLDTYKCKVLDLSCQKLLWNGSKLDKKEALDHVFDAATYPVEFFCPIKIGFSKYNTTDEIIEENVANA